MKLNSIKESFVPKSEQTALLLASLYGSYGFRRYKVGCFEDFAGYLESKNFMPSEQVITFGGRDGKLLALKPDITMSIAKNVNIDEGYTEKLFYKENVFRAYPGGDFKEISQMGVEMIGALDSVCMSEFVSLALQSLAVLSDEYILDISHIGFIGGLASYYGLDENTLSAVLSLTSERNVHGLKALEKEGLKKEAVADFCALVELSGSKDALQKLVTLSKNEETKKACSELQELFDSAKILGFDGRLRIDFTVSSDFNYYSGLVCKGYVSSIPRSVLSGGRYDKMISRLKKKTCSAVGFAVYLGEALSDSAPVKPCYLVYKQGQSFEEVEKAVKELRDKGLCVKTSSFLPENGYDKLFVLDGGEIKEVDGGEKC